MREYPSIDHSTDHIPSGTIYAFNKIDGQQIRAEWRADKGGFWKFGTKTRLLPEHEPIVSQAYDLVPNQYGDKLGCVFREEGYQRVTCFLEMHDSDSQHGRLSERLSQDVTLFDVWPDCREGILNPEEFLDMMSHIDHPPLLYKGLDLGTLVDRVESGDLEGMGQEGIVGKVATSDHTHPFMFKCKRSSWYR
jgi:hypothetical protein